jgi:hypothetical protein
MIYRCFVSCFCSFAVAAIFCAMMPGCTSRPSFVRSANADPALRKSNAEFAADAAHRQYEANANRAGAANGGVEIDYGFHYLSLVNSSSQDWNNVEIWVNQKYVIMIPKISADAARAEIVSFDMIYDSHGASFPTDSQKTPITSVEMYSDGKMFTLMTQLAD